MAAAKDGDRAGVRSSGAADLPADCEGSDTGVPLVVSEPSAGGRAFMAAAERAAAQISIASYSRSTIPLTVFDEHRFQQAHARTAERPLHEDRSCPSWR